MHTTQNWIERRALRDKQLSRAVELWRDVIDAVLACAKSFNKEYTHLGRIHTQAPDPSKIKVFFYRQAQVPGHESAAQMNRVVSFEFEEAKPTIRVTVGHDTPRVFEIKADEGRCCLLHGGQEISVDEFSRLALEDMLFDSAKQHKVQSAPR
jgi:hypothetical protein